MTSPWILLASPGNHPLSQHYIMARNPKALIRVKNGVITLQEGAHTTTITNRNPWEFVEQYIAARHQGVDTRTPFKGGLVGYIGYEAGQYLEKVPRHAQDDLGLPDMWLMEPGEVEVSTTPPLSLSEGQKKLQHPPLNWSPAISKTDYLARVQTILHHIREGDIYQANLSQRFSADFNGDPFVFWQQLMRQNPAPFYAYIHDPEFQILCTSPERLLCQRGDTVESRPIKGTRPRGHTESDDAAMRAELAQSDKEGAELAMIVDLVRNDLHRVCVTGSVEVRHHRVIEAYQNVFHQISVVTGKLPQQDTMLKALAALFPGGSITGCPKIRAMEIITDQEPTTRGIYTGAIGYASFHGTQDWNIAIRTAVVKDGKIYLSVGGGIVADSDPEKEYDETLHKAHTFFRFSSLPK